MMRTTYVLNSLHDLEQVLSAFEKVLVGPEASVSNGESLFAMARKALAASALGYVRSAYDHGHPSEEPVEDYMAFAARVWPGINKTWRWRALAPYVGAHDGPVNRGWGAAARRVAEDLRWRVRRRRWRWTGL
jgi:hypothetical protein